MMKKVIACMILILAISLITSCDGTSSMNYIVTSDYLEGDTLKINISLKNAVPITYSGNYSSQFHDRITVEELSDHIDNSDTDDYDLSTEIFQ